LELRAGAGKVSEDFQRVTFAEPKVYPFQATTGGSQHRSQFRSDYFAL